jgi:hypothetical protein
MNKTLDKQLEEFAEEKSLPNALGKLGILHSGEDFKSAHLVRDWTRGGAETYNLIFEIVSSQRRSSYILKACVPFSPAIAIDRVLAGWIDRRNLLQNQGVTPPRLYGVRLGMLLEDFIPYELSTLAPSKWNTKIVQQVFHLAKSLTELRFAAVSPFADLRTDEVLIYPVDFGSDLGGPYVTSAIPDYFALAQNWLESLNVSAA